MATAIPKISLSSSRDIPFNKLVLSQSNVRRVKAGLSIEELGRDIERRGLLQSLNVRPVLDGEGAETGTYEVPAGGRRFRALELLVKQKKLAKTAPVPCVVREAGSAILAEDDSLAENVQRLALHPLDQFRAFRDMLEKGMSEEEIAAAFFVTPAVVKQRLRLMTVSDKLLDIYEQDGMRLEQLMAFSISDDHARQEQVWEIVAQSHNREPYVIRRMLTEKTVRASDARVRFVGLDTYLAAGGPIMRDLFEADDGGWLQDPAILDRLVMEKLHAAAEDIRAEGWKWVETALSFPWGHTRQFAEIDGTEVPLSDEETVRLEALRAEQEAIEAEYAQADEYPDEVDARLGEIEQAILALEERPLTLTVPGQNEPIAPTHWSFGQMCSLVSAPSSYLRNLPAPLAAINLQHGLLSHRAELLKTLETEDGRVELRAVTGPDYGRIWDHELVGAVRKIARDGTGDTNWKVPGVIDWATMTHNPYVDITKETTTLYASDRDVFLFLVDDTHPIEAGRLPNGEPDLYFRGFYAWNSEVGSKSLGIASFYLRGVCQNRMLWGVENFEQITIRHSKFAASRFVHQATPALRNFATASPTSFVSGIQASRRALVAKNDDDRETFLRRRGFSKPETTKIIETVLHEEGRKPESVFDFVQGITALARTKTNQDTRLDLEGRARKLMEKVG